MPTCILRTAKLKTMGNIAGSAKHNFRERETPNANLGLISTNMTTGAQSSAEVLAAVEERLKTVPTVRKNAVRAVEYFIGASSEFFKDSTPQKVDAFFASAKNWLEERHGAKNVIAFTRHNDETSPHVCAYVVPIDDRGRLNAAGWLDGNFKLSQMQTSFYEGVGKPMGLERGILGSKAAHQDLQIYYGRLAAPTPALTISIPDVPVPTISERLAEKAGLKTAHSNAVEAAESAKKKQNAQARDRRLALEAKANQFDADQAGRSAREAELVKLRENAQNMRAIPLEDVLESFGAKRSTKDKHNFDTAVGRITVTKSKFFNHDLGKGGGGAIDLVMQLEDCDYKAAVAKLARSFGVDHVAGDLAFHAKQQVEQTLKEPRTPSLLPEAAPERWPAVRDYLTKVRALSAEIVDSLYEKKLLFADKFSNACFVLGLNREQGTSSGVELRGTLAETTFHGVRGKKASFVLWEGKGTQEKRIALVEAAIDAISLRQLGFEGRILSTTGNVSMEYHAKAAAKEKNLTFIAAFDADKAGDKMAADLQRLCLPGQVQRLRPLKGKDWNDEVKKTDRSAPAERFDLDSRFQLELQRQKQARSQERQGLGR